ncbi:ABC-2 type transport system permease protein [Reichenbachiella faecimaris]|uniref:ABC-2 type transport system permease protein n=1 Tax=Reichenbachiella faecimaris TaxID=692418 RepID=A0A1W2GET6_REIFA|nr:ABC transporter permease [Reichenbachiella faecimaris]SMD35189.1 ABC-2 type transport system permease protein [Reichenbachiella faecimaris]
MNKIGLIIAREYIARVKKKSFIIMTILGPILFAGMMGIVFWSATREGDQKLIQVIDESGWFENNIENTETITYQFIQADVEETKESLLNSDAIFGLLHIPKLDLDNPKGIKFYSTQSPGIAVEGGIEKIIRGIIEDEKLANSGLDQELIDNLRAHVDIQTINLSDSGDESESNSGIAFGVGYVSSFLLYMFIFIYGMQIMRGVTQEKTSRIIEVMIASVRPFELMMGKIIGIAAVGLTQFVLWAVMTTALTSVTSSLILDQPTATEQMAFQAGVDAEQMEAQNEAFDIYSITDKIDIPIILGSFLIYFLGGYLLYGALLAAVGSAVDSEADSQQFMLPITLPLIFSMMMISIVIQEPHGTMAFWLSIIPFTSPVIMMMRLPFDVPMWELALSILLLIAGFCSTTWMAGRIYRIGIFMHGTKVNYKTLAKWFVMKI